MCDTILSHYCGLLTPFFHLRGSMFSTFFIYLSRNNLNQMTAVCSDWISASTWNQTSLQAHILPLWWVVGLSNCVYDFSLCPRWYCLFEIEMNWGYPVLYSFASESGDFRHGSLGLDNTFVVGHVSSRYFSSGEITVIKSHPASVTWWPWYSHSQSNGSHTPDLCLSSFKRLQAWSKK